MSGGVRFKVVQIPFGVMTVLVSFQLVIDIVLLSVELYVALLLLEEILFVSRNVRDCMEHLQQMPTLLRDAGVRVK